MDVQQKRQLVSDWFRGFAQEHGFDVILTDELAFNSGLLLQVEKSQFKDINSQTAIPDRLLRNTPPRVLLHELLPQRGREMIQAYSEALRTARLKR